MNFLSAVLFYFFRATALGSKCGGSPPLRRPSEELA
jgi:hypothetical protein